MKIITFKRKILNAIGEICEREEVDIVYIDFIYECNFLKFIMKFNKNNKKFGISYMFSLEYMDYELEDFLFRINKEIKGLK